jgi:hypothetical protein
MFTRLSLVRCLPWPRYVPHRLPDYCPIRATGKSQQEKNPWLLCRIQQVFIFYSAGNRAFRQPFFDVLRLKNRHTQAAQRGNKKQKSYDGRLLEIDSGGKSLVGQTPHTTWSSLFFSLKKIVHRPPRIANERIASSEGAVICSAHEADGGCTCYMLPGHEQMEKTRCSGRGSLSPD